MSVIIFTRLPGTTALLYRFTLHIVKLAIPLSMSSILYATPTVNSIGEGVSTATSAVPELGWADSYSANGRCYIDSTFDHGIGDKIVSTPIGGQSVRQVAARMGSGPGRAGNPVYNDVQCGNGPANNAGEEDRDQCPGRVDIGASGCLVIGPRWDLRLAYGKSTSSSTTPSLVTITAATSVGPPANAMVHGNELSRTTASYKIPSTPISASSVVAAIKPVPVQVTGTESTAAAAQIDTRTAQALSVQPPNVQQLKVQPPRIQAPMVNGDTISWTNGGWYQVQIMGDYDSSMCEGEMSCTVEPGAYVVINHTTGERWENIVVDDVPTGGSTAPVVNDNTISWSNSGWHQVQIMGDYASSLCEGETSCTVSNGTYVVINHTTGERWENIVVDGAPTTDSTAPMISGNTISWTNNGWYQVQIMGDYASSLCEGETSCTVSNGTYVVINHTTSERWENIVVDAGPALDDPSALRAPLFGDLDDDLAPANEGAFEGGEFGTPEDVAKRNVIAEADQRADGLYFNIPTNGPPSPLFGIQPFTQQMLRFEEFGSKSIDWSVDAEGMAFPAPLDSQSSPDAEELDAFLGQEHMSPRPSEFSNTRDLNPWENEIASFLGRNLNSPPAEGRPPGLGWAHQRWNEFKPQTAFTTAQSGARTNSGLRDLKQMHRYNNGEFAPGGLYHNTVGEAGFDGTVNGIEARLHPGLPVQDPQALWTFDGTFPPKLLKARYGESLVMRHYNGLPIDVSANRGFGVHTLTTHEHNGHNPAESDGFANAFFFPGQYYDYRWPMALAGHDSINTTATDPRAGMPDGRGGITNIKGDWHETMSTHWFHDHMLDFTAQNVYKGNVAMMNYYSALDRGNEGLDDGVNLRLPSGTALDWGNRDYDVNLLLAEKSWDEEGQLWFNPFNQGGFLGDMMTVNWLYKPYLDVRARKYRFRILNGSVSRYFKIALVDELGNRVPFHMIGNDGNIMEHTVLFEDGELPTLGVAERYDIIVDFSQFEPGAKLHFVNLLQHRNGQSTDDIIPLEDILTGTYQPEKVDSDEDGIFDSWENGDPVVGKFLEFRVAEYDGEDLSLNPARYVAGGKKLIPLQRPTETELANALHRTFEFEKQPTDETPWVIETDGGKGTSMDPRRLSAAPTKNSGGLEVWRIVNSGTWSHPIHIHFEEGIILRRNGLPPPEWEKWARKDVYRLGPQEDSGEMVEIALRFREFAGSFMEHCHNTQHEDHAMLLRWDIENPGQVKMMPSPIPSWDGVSYVDTVALPTARTGDGIGQFGPSLADEAVQIWVQGVEVEEIDMVNMTIGDALNPTEDERAVAKVPLRRGINIDSEGNERDVFFVLHDISDEALAEDMGIAWAGGLVGTPVAATSEATVSDSGVFTFFGDLPNPVMRINPAFTDLNDPEAPAQSVANDYSPLRRVTIAGSDVIVNAFFVQWGDRDWERLRIDENCTAFPDEPPNTACRYNGQNWGGDTGHALEINTAGPDPYVKLKLHKSWTNGADYLPYYVVVDSFPAGPANNMGIIYVPKHEFLAGAAVPLVQFLPDQPLSGSYPPTPSDFLGLPGGGPLGGQIGLPSYFMPEDDYSPLWHIGFTHWLEPADRVVKGLDELKQLRDQGKVEIFEWPAVRVGNNDYDFENLNSPHVVNCPTPVTIDRALHVANKQHNQATASSLLQ